MGTKMTREEALKIVQSATVWTDEERDALAMLIPGLAESEDERIREELVEAFEALDIDSSWNGIPVKSILAWLKDQKPAEKHDLVTQLKEHFANTPKEQLEAEWKELEHWNNIGPTVEEYFHRIKPAEWSEEDEKKMIFLERLIEHNVPDGQYGWVDGMKGGFVTKSEAISMLKSLRPSWKPSEEQMKALNEIVNILAASPFFHQNDYLFNILNGLREELKKLL